MHFTTSVVALGLASVARAHIAMTMPIPFGKSTLNNSPLELDGSDFPCKQRTGVYEVEGASNPMSLGSTQPLNFIGSAVHGGGSCQISITYDSAPTKDSVWKVIHSIEGGCPMQGVTGNNGDNPNKAADSYSFTVPTGLPTGSAVLAWTWFNKVGNREMYMNCAPIELIGGNAKRMERNVNGELVSRDPTELMKRSQANYDALPDMFTANIGNGCATLEGSDVLFPNAGDSVEQLGQATSTALATPVGACQAGPTGGSGSAPTANAAAATQAPSPTATGLPGGIFLENGGSPQPTSTPVVVAAPVATTTAAAAPAPTVESTGPSGNQNTAPDATVPDVTVPEVTVPDTTVPASGGSAVAAGAACPGQEGSWNCIGGTSFQRCASGTWSVIQPLAAGTNCEAGVSVNIKIAHAGAKRRRAVRFSNEHVRRHMMHSS